MTLKTSRTVIPSFLSVLGLIALAMLLMSCAGSPPKQERPVKFYSGSAAKRAMCRRTKAAMTKWVLAIAKYDLTKEYAAQVLEQVMAADAEECIGSDQKEFTGMIGLSADDMRVMLQYEENLLYKCAKWNP